MAWQGPAIMIYNNAIFKTNDFDSLMQIRVGGKQGDDTMIGKHELGLNPCYHFTDVPSFISDSIAFLDPHEKFLTRRHGIEGIDFRSTFRGTLFRIPLQKQPSDISDSIFATDQTLELFTKNISGLTENDYWIIVTGAHSNPEDHQLKKYVKRYRLRVLGGIAALYKISKDDNNRRDFVFENVAELHSSYGSDRRKLLMERDYSSDIDRQKLNWNRHILLDFLPNLFNLITKVVELNYSKYAIEYGFKVLEHLLQNDEILINGFRLDPSFKSLLRSLPIWSTISHPERSISDSYNPLDEDPKKLLKPASCGYILTNSFHQHRIKTRSIFLDASNNNSRQILTDLNVPTRDIYVYTFEDVEFPKKYDSCYLDFLKDILKDIQIIQGVSSAFLHPDFSKYTENLSKIGLKIASIKRYLKTLKEFHSSRLPKVWGNLTTYTINTQSLDCLNNIILPAYREVAWSQMPLIAEDVIPSQQVLEKYPSFGKPDVSTVVRHLRFLYSILRYDEVWKKDWTDAFKNNIYEVYKWLNEECSSNVDRDLSEHICFEPLFLNFRRNKHPFNLENWVSADDLVLNSEFGDAKNVYPDLAKYSTMLKSAGAREIKRLNVKIKNIDDAIQKLNDNYQDSKLSLYKDLLEISSDYKLDYLKELMELRLSRIVHMSNVGEMKTFAEISSASQLYEYCYQFIRDNSEL
ncbi:5658_t:CDS:10 [Funneliformis caledonium]|uniref:5658_t:CDS:1 n=1 Tax=Funneliformis caledonium TaxID=1117310 RepID=A0A9N8W379_9GLOM|nr:5658_t:CDS:10 [Funneliformis caledonium]